MITRLGYRINLWLEPWFPEQRMFLKSDTTTRFVRLRPMTQAISATVGVLAVAWTLFATAVLLMDFINSGSSREQVQRQTALFEQRLNALSDDRDLRVAEAASAQQRFNLALGQVSAMQERLLASETRLRELETGIDVIQNTLRRTIRERDDARAEVAQARVALNQLPGTTHTDMGQAQDVAATLDIMAKALTDTARDRDSKEADVAAQEARTAAVAKQKAELEARNAVIFGKLEDALTVSVEPLQKMFKAAGLNPDDLISAVKSGYSGQGGPLSPISFSTMGLSGSPDETRANAILQGLDTLNLYRIAAFKVPLGLPLRTTFRYTSGFGVRGDPINGSNRMHEGQDMAGDYGSSVYATADGTVTYAGWESGYGRLIKITHAFGIETRYGHLSQIEVNVGQKVSRGEKIGDMGNSGRSTGTHLHYEVRLSGTAVNPMTFIRAAKDVF
ncbi:peptidoglycan DD-metalloendopeptidase family protein [bacterium]|nr:peptidoglycan DD-metalloendopeptidase family protein [bacterium]